ncbi:MAG: site-specific DNA-methyltransferase [Bacillota bacterium]
MDSLTRLQSLFRELFQFDFADLDFGLYRLFHLKRAEVEAFINEQLPREAEAAFAELGGADQARLEEELHELAGQVREHIADDAILSTGEINPEYRQSGIKFVRELAAKYEAARQQIQTIHAAEERKAEVFNHLYNFFSRYYEDGDFIPKRRYGARETYAVPYNGEEVFFTWANRDQHYVKTAERFQDYAFKVSDLTGEYRVRFTLTEASIPKDNTKGNTRFFFPRPDLLAWDGEARELTIPFEYRLPTGEEAERYGSNSKGQEAVLQEALAAILEAVSEVNLRALLAEDQRNERDKEENKPVLPLLLKRLRHFCKRNTSDYFIHKDLRGFLTRELEFYIKDQVIHLMDLEADLEAKRCVIRTFRRLAEKVIDFLANVEDAQKRLFEKRKFVLQTDYLIPIQHVPREFWQEILANAEQRDEWNRWLALEPARDLFNPKGEMNEAFLEAHPTLPVHTAHFGRDFLRRLLEALPFDDLDEATDGLLVYGENYQALRLLLERYRDQVKCIHIDPPYNTETSGFLYKNNYRHSSWLSMMYDRVRLSLLTLESGGAFACHIDEYEFERFSLMLDEMEGVKAGTLVWDRGMPVTGRFGIATQHEYVVWRTVEEVKLAVRKKNVDVIAKMARSLLEKYGGPTKAAIREFNVWLKDNPDLSPAEKTYNMFDDEGKVFRSDNMSATDRRTDPKFYVPLIHPLTKKPCPVPEYGWRYTPDTISSLLAQGLILFGPDHTTIPRKKTLLDDARENQLPSIYRSGMRGKGSLDSLGLFFPFSHGPDYYQYILDSATDEVSVILDFFAGSGTTGHAVINLNREDGGRRKFILVEMGEYFDTVLLPRIAKVMYTPEWKGGKPERKATPEEAERTPRLVKILRLESYEDALHNLAAPSTLERAKEREAAYRELAGEDRYRLRYWIELPLEAAETTLRALDLRHPFRYSLEILTEDGPVHKPVDVVETFNYLYGLRVCRCETWVHNGRAYRVVKAADREGKRRILVLWRDMEDLDVEAERAFLEGKITAMSNSGETWEEILINGDTPTPGIQSLDPLFKRLMMQGEAG